jgi:hypothetical protein
MAYISYIPDPFFKITDKQYLNKHQNRRETLLIGKIFNELGLGIKVERFDKIFVYMSKRFDVVFGLEPNFMKAIAKNPKAIKIYYATGAYYKHQNTMIIQRTDEVNAKNKFQLSYQRLIKPHNSCEEADYIFQIGNLETIETYPVNLRNKIFLIRQSCYDYNYNIQSKLFKYDRHHFMWMGSNGSILKGLDLILDFFHKNKEYTLHVVGNIDKDFHKAYCQVLEHTHNIQCHGFLSIDSVELINIAEKCIAIIFPSCSEGFPGSVINMSKLGLIPIVSKWCAYKEINKLGYLLPQLDVESILSAINWIDNLPKSELEDLFFSNYEYANTNFNQSTFELDFTTALVKILNENNS